MELLRTRDFVSVDYEQSMNSYGITVLARKRTGSYARFIMTNDTFTNWMRGDGGKHLASVAELYWGTSGDTEQSLKHELDIETEADVETRSHLEQITEETRQRLEGLLVGQSVGSLDRLVSAAREITRDMRVRVPATPDYIPLTFSVPGQEISIANLRPTHLMSFRNHEGTEVAYVDNDGNYVKVGAAPAPSPPPEEPAGPQITGRIIDLE
jgi:hypothetical protein